MKETTWTIDKIKDGFERFYQTHNCYPTAYDVDDFEFLPSSRQIQRSFGGLVNLRKILRLRIRDYGKGKNRSKIAANSNITSKQCETIIFKLLKEQFSDEFIHIERPVIIDGKGKDRYDFFVYAKPSNFAIDVFSTEGDSRSLIKIMNIKENKYRKISNASEIKLYFIYFGEKIEKNKVYSWLNNKREKFPSNWKILSFEEFKVELDNYDSFKVY